jgi:hypothetical protein
MHQPLHSIKVSGKTLKYYWASQDNSVQWLFTVCITEVWFLAGHSFIFATMLRLAVGPTQPTIQWVTEALSAKPLVMPLRIQPQLYYCDLFLDFLHRPYVFQPRRFEGWLFPRHRWSTDKRLARSTGPTRVGSPDDEGRAIPRNVVVEKHRDDGESPKNRSQ